MPVPTQDKKLRVFVSHSSKDKDFVRKLVDDLEALGFDLWFDERAIDVGDSIVSEISKGLDNADYLLVILSKSSVLSTWVQAEVNTALMGELSNKGITVLPAIIEDCDIPTLLRDRLYVDFRPDYTTGLDTLANFFKRDTSNLSAQVAIASASTDCLSKLSKIKQIDLRRRIQKKMKRTEIRAIWNGTLGGDMNDEVGNRDLLDCILDLLDRASKRDLISELISNICEDCPHIANP